MDEFNRLDLFEEKISDMKIISKDKNDGKYGREIKEAMQMQCEHLTYTNI